MHGLSWERMDKAIERIEALKKENAHLRGLLEEAGETLALCSGTDDLGGRGRDDNGWREITTGMLDRIRQALNREEGAATERDELIICPACDKPSEELPSDGGCDCLVDYQEGDW